MNEPKEIKSTVIKNQKICYTKYGNSKETILLIHGFSIDSSIWEHMIPHLTKYFTVITLDLIGYGLNHSLTFPVNINSQTEFIYKVVEDIKNVDYIIGYSYGGRILYEYNFHPNSSIKKTIIIAAPFFHSPFINIISMLLSLISKNKLLTSFVVFLFTHVPLKQMLFRICSLASLKNTPVINECIAKLYKEPNKTSIFKGLSYIFKPYKKTHQFLIPTHYIYGDCDGIAKLTNLKLVIKNLLPSNFTILKGIYHLVPLECPTNLANIIVKTLTI